MKLETKSYLRNWNIRVSAEYFKCISCNNLKYSRSWGRSHDTENVMSGMELLLLVFPAMYIGRTLWEKMKHQGLAVYWNDVWNSAILLSVALHVSSFLQDNWLFFPLFLFTFFFPSFSFLRKRYKLFKMFIL